MNQHKPSAALETSGVETRHWTLVGSSKTGKTSFLFAALQRPESSHALRILPGPTTNNLLRERLVEQRRLTTVAGTSTAILQYDIRASSNATDATDWPHITLTDGPGGNLLPAVGDAPDPVRDADRKAYEGAVERSEGILVFLPYPTAIQTADMEWITRVTEFVNGLAVQAGPLQRIGLCISKTDLSDKFKAATAPSATAAQIDALTRAAYLAADPNGNVCHALANLRLFRRSVSVAIFAVSAFGSVGHTGYPNVIPTLDLPLVHHLALSGSTGRHGVPLYPRPFTEAEVNTLWRPFNHNAPLRFLFDGHISDQAGLSIDEMRLAER